MNLRCRLGCHLDRIVTPFHGFDLNQDVDSGNGFEHPRYLHISVCDRCGKVSAYVGDNYWSRHDAHMRREATEIEVRRSLVDLDRRFLVSHLEAITKQYQKKGTDGRNH